MSSSTDAVIAALGLEQNIEGAYFKRTACIDGQGGRGAASSIYFLVPYNDVSYFHSLDCDELWYFHGGSPLDMHIISPQGVYKKHVLSGENPFLLVEKGMIFGAACMSEGSHSLCSCVCVPEFVPSGFVLYSHSCMTELFPQHRELIDRMSAMRQVRV